MWVDQPEPIERSNERTSISSENRDWAVSSALEDREYDDRFAAVPFVILSGCAAVQETGHVSRGFSCPGHISVDALAFRVFFSHQFISPTYRLLTFPPPIFLVRASIAS